MIGYHERGQGEPLLLLSGMAVSGRAWPPPWLERLERSFRLVMVDNRGTGSSPNNGEPFSMSDLAGDAAAALDGCRLASVNVLGQSMGAMIGLTLAAEHPTRVRRLIIGAGSPGGRLAVPAAPHVMADLARLSRGESHPGELPRLVAAPGFADRHPDAVAALSDQHQRDRINPSVIGLQVRAIAGFDPATLARVGVPTLVVHGAADPMVPVENGRRLAAAIPGARLEVLDGVGHLILHEAPDRYAELVERFLVAG